MLGGVILHQKLFHLYGIRHYFGFSLSFSLSVHPSIYLSSAYNYFSL